MKRRSFIKTAGVLGLGMTGNLFAGSKDRQKPEQLCMYDTEGLYKEVIKTIEMDYELFYSHLEYLYYDGSISYPRTKATKLHVQNDFKYLSKNEYEFLKFKKPYLIDFEGMNNHSPLVAFKLDKTYKTEVFTEKDSEFTKEDFYNKIFDEKLKHLDFIYSKIEQRTKTVIYS